MNLIETIKGSRAIVILVILYILITICVFAVDHNNEDKKSSSTNKTTTQETKTNEKTNNDEKSLTDDEALFVDEIDNIYSSVKAFIESHEIVDNTCLPLTTILGVQTDGSVYISNNFTNINLWYKSSNNYVVNNLLLNGSEITKNDIKTAFDTPFYNKCGQEN